MESGKERSEWVRGFEQLEVFRRAYRVSLELHRATLDFPRIEQFAFGGSSPSGIENRSAPTWPKGLGVSRYRDRSFAGL